MSETYDKINHWCGWNGGECPVHPETEVEVIGRIGPIHGRRAGNFDWSRIEQSVANIIAFRITRLYVEPRKPREWWMNDYGAGQLGDLQSSRETVPLTTGVIGVIHVREVLPEDEA